MTMTTKHWRDSTRSLSPDRMKLLGGLANQSLAAECPYLRVHPEFEPAG